MKKEKMRLVGVAVAVLIAYNFAVFMIPCLKTPTFWISWGYTLLSFVVSGYAFYASLIKKTDTKSRFYGFPIARIAIVYLVLQIALGGVCMALGHITPWWVPTVLFAIGLALAVIGLVSTETVIDQIQQQDDTLKKNVYTIRNFQSKLNLLAGQTENAAIKALAEELRYSDPVSNESLADIEAALAAAIDVLQAITASGDDSAVSQQCHEISTLLAERNRLCKLNKAQ